MANTNKLLSSLLTTYSPSGLLSTAQQTELFSDLLPNNLGSGTISEPFPVPKTIDQTVSWYLSEDGRNKRNQKPASIIIDSQAELQRVGWGSFPSRAIQLALPAPPKEPQCSKQLLKVFAANNSKLVSSSRHLGGNIFGPVKKLGGKFFQRWNLRHLVLSHSGLQWYKNESQAMRLASNEKALSLSQIRTISRFTELTHSIFCLHLVDGQVIKFATTTAAQADQWRAKISTFCLVEAVTHGGPQMIDRMEHLIDVCDADLNADTIDGPLLRCTVNNENYPATELLLKRGADARLMLRMDVIRGKITPQRVIELLEQSGRDLNLVANDDNEDAEGGWSLLHHLIVKRDLRLVMHLLERIDSPTVRHESNSGETALSLLLKRLPMDELLENSPTAATTKSLSFVDMVFNLTVALLKHGADPNHMTNGDSALHLACKRPLLGRVSQVLLECPQLDPNRCDSVGDAALHIALKTNQLALAKLIAQDKRTNINLRDGLGESALILAMRLGQQDFACFLLSLSADGDKGSGQRSESIRQRGGSKAVEEMLKNGERISMPPPDLLENPDDVYIPAEALDRPIHLAVKLRMTQLCLKLIPLVNVGLLDGRGRSALHTAILHGLLGVAHALVEKGNGNCLDLQDTHTGDTALHLAIRTGRVELALSLLQHGASVNVQNELGESPLHSCVRLIQRQQGKKPFGAKCSLFLLQELLAKSSNLSTELVTKLCTNVPVPLQHGSKIGAQASRGCVGGQTALHWAVSNHSDLDSWRACEMMIQCNKCLVKVLDGAGLCALGVAIDLLNEHAACKMIMYKEVGELNCLLGDKEESLLHIACRRGLVQCVEGLLKSGAYPISWDLDGYTPLQAGLGNEKIVKSYCQVLTTNDRTYLNCRTESGIPTLNLAIQFGHAKSVEFLLRSGADIYSLESMTRYGPFQRAVSCTETSFIHATSVAQVLLELIPCSKPLNEKESDARKNLLELVLMSKEPDEAPPPLPATKLILKTIEIPVSGSGSKRTQMEALQQPPSSPPSAVSQQQQRSQPSTMDAVKDVEDKARDEAERFLQLEEGRRILQRMAQEISATFANEKDSLSAEAAMQFAAREYVQNAVADAQRRFKLASVRAMVA